MHVNYMIGEHDRVFGGKRRDMFFFRFGFRIGESFVVRRTASHNKPELIG